MAESDYDGAYPRSRKGLRRRWTRACADAGGVAHQRRRPGPALRYERSAHQLAA